jgi:hypothetical protein
LFTSLIHKRSLIQGFIFLGVSAFSVLFTFVYYRYSHEVYSDYISYLFIIPLCLSAFYLVLFFFHKEAGIVGTTFLDTGAPTLMIYSALQGVYEIAETYNEWSVLFLVVGIVLAGLGIVFSFLHVFGRDPLGR